MRNLLNLVVILCIKSLLFPLIYRVINVPISDDNIAKRVNSLPRTEDNSGMVNIGLKRKLNMKNFHKFGLINPDRVYKACEFLIINHPAYKDIKLKPYDEWAEKCPSLFSHTDKSDEENVDSSDEEEVETKPEKSAEKLSVHQKKDKDQAESNDFNAVTCLYPKEPASNLIVNHSNEKKKIKFKRKAKKIYDIAPG